MELPKPYLNANASQKLKLLIDKQFHKPIIQFLEHNEIKSKILEDIEMSKVFSMVVFQYNDIMESIGLTKSTNDLIVTQGTKKYALQTSHLLEIFNLLKSDSVQKNLQVLSKYKDSVKQYSKQIQKDEN